MFKVNDAVFYGVHGVCTIEEISKKEIFGSVNEYYTLKPVYSDRSKVFVPVDRADKTVDLREVLSKDDIPKIMDALKNAKSIWIEDSAQRKAKFVEILRHGNHTSLAALLKTVYDKKISLAAENKKLHAADERAFVEGEKILSEELAFVLGIERKKIPEYIASEIKKQ